MLKDFYRIRSSWSITAVRQPSQDVEVIDRFFLNVWLTLRRLLAEVDRYKMREELLGRRWRIKEVKATLADRLRGKGNKPLAKKEMK